VLCPTCIVNSRFGSDDGLLTNHDLKETISKAKKIVSELENKISQSEGTDSDGSTIDEYSEEVESWSDNRRVLCGDCGNPVDREYAFACADPHCTIRREKVDIGEKARLYIDRARPLCSFCALQGHRYHRRMDNLDCFATKKELVGGFVEILECESELEGLFRSIVVDRALDVLLAPVIDECRVTIAEAISVLDEQPHPHWVAEERQRVCQLTKKTKRFLLEKDGRLKELVEQFRKQVSDEFQDAAGEYQAMDEADESSRGSEERSWSGCSWWSPPSPDYSSTSPLYSPSGSPYQ